MTAKSRSCRARRSTIVLVFIIIASVAIAAPVSAGTIGIKGTTLIVGADPFEQIVLVASTSGADLVLTGEPFQIVTPGCRADDPQTIRCALSGFTALTIIGSQLDDVVNVSAIGALNVFVATKDGNDIILGGNGDEVLSAGNGDDIVFGNSVKNVIFSGPGNDLVIGCCRSNDPAPPDPEPLKAQPMSESSTMIFVGLGLAACVLTQRRLLM